MNGAATLRKAALTALLCLSAAPAAVAADFSLDYRASATLSAGGGDFAPSYLSANNFGTLTQPNTATARIALDGGYQASKRLRLTFAVDVIGGYASKTDYSIYDTSTGQLSDRAASNAALRLQQLFGQVSYRSVFLYVGMKETESVLVNQELSSGDLCMSGNTRPMPGVKAGFVDFQNIPFTGGWVQINGAAGYYKTLDGDWMEDRYNYANYFITTGYTMNYKYLHLRTNPDKPFSVTVGMQAACQIGGTVKYYQNGELTSSEKYSLSLSDYFKAFIPGGGGGSSGDQTYFEGNHVGTWDLMLTYRLKSGERIKLIYQSPFEDGSGIGKQNGFDGLYGIEYVSAGNGLVEGAVVEYLDLMNQSGPIHWDPSDYSAGTTTITSQATGMDNYYNNYMYNGYQYYGQALGTPMVRTALYNTDGYLRITDNRIRAFHVALKGHLSRSLSYRAKFGYRKSWGTPQVPLENTRSATSFMVEATYSVPGAPGLEVKCQVGADFGELVGDNTGGLVTVTYSGSFTGR